MANHRTPILGGSAKQRKQKERAAARRARQLAELNRGPNYPWWATLSEDRRRELLSACGQGRMIVPDLLTRQWDALPKWARHGIKRMKRTKDARVIHLVF